MDCGKRRAFELMAGGSHIDAVLEVLRVRYGKECGFGRSKRLFKFGVHFSCSINYSKELRGTKFFYGLSSEVLDPNFEIPATEYGHYVLLTCGREDAVLWLPRTFVLQAMQGVVSRKLDVFFEDGRYILQTTGHPKIDVTQYLNSGPPISTTTDAGVTPEPDKGRSHSEIQLGLAKLGRAEGCKVWVPSSDRNLRWKSESLREYTCDRLPNFGFDENTRRVVSNIDVLWLEGNIIRRAFEVEATTSIYSGLLRLNDLCLAQPNNRIELCIVAEEARRHRVVGQMMRPTFRPLVDTCSFVGFGVVRGSVEQAEQLNARGVTRVHGLLTTERITLPDRLILDASDLQS